MKHWKIFIGLAVIAALVTLSFLLDLPRLLVAGLEYINNLGIAGALLFIALYILATVAFVPGSILTLGAGFVFGLGPGTIYVSIGSTIGAAAAFLLGRSLFRGWITEKTAKNPRFAAIDQAVAVQGWKIVLLTRLSPIFPYNALNYAYGLTKIQTGPYILASWVGMLPGTLLYVYMGSLAGDLTTAAAGTASTPQSWTGLTIKILGFAATLLVTILITKTARNALKQHVEG